MRLFKPFLGMLLWLPLISVASAQDRKAANPAAEPPTLVVLVRQEIQPGRNGERQKLQVALSRACDRLDTPGFWIDLQSLTGVRETLLFNPFDSFELFQQAHTGWRQFYAAHPDLAQTHGEIDSLVGTERTIVAVRQDDMGAPAEDVDLSEARFMRVLEIRLFPGRESEFKESMNLWSQARTKTNAELPLVVYKVNDGTTSPAFVVFMPFSELKDDILLQKENTLEATEEGSAAERLRQIIQEAYVSIESNLYSVNPEMSHVPKEFAAEDAGFWRPGFEPGMKPEAKPEAKPDVTRSKKKASVKPLP